MKQQTLLQTKPDWSNLKAHRCPLCGCLLRKVRFGNSESPNKCSSKKCAFIIGNKKLLELMELNKSPESLKKSL